MKKILTISLISIIILGCSSPHNNRNTYNNQATRNTKQYIVKTEDGDFIVNGLHASNTVIGATITGSVTNNTTKDWNDVKLGINVFGVSGRKIATAYPEFYSLKKGQTVPIGLANFGEQLTVLIPNESPSHIDPTFISGNYNASYSFAIIKPKENESLTFSDKFLDFAFEPSQQQISFIIKNKIDAPAKIDWNSAAYVDVNGRSHRVMNSGVKFSEKDRPLAPSVIPPGANVSDMVFPVDHASYRSGKYGGWDKEPLFPNAPAAKSYKGKSFSIFLPIEIDGNVKNYNFVFIINDITT